MAAKANSSSSTDTDDEPEMPVSLSPDATVDDLDTETRYVAKVHSVKTYGVFVTLTSPHTTDVSGLVHESELPPLTQPRDFNEGERMVVSFQHERDNGDLSFTAHYGERHGPDGPFPEDAFDADAGDVADAQPTADTGGGSDVDVGALTDEIHALGDRVDTLADRVAEAESDDCDEQDGGLPVTSPVQDAIASLQTLADSGYKPASLEKQYDGDTVELSIRLREEDSDD